VTYSQSLQFRNNVIVKVGNIEEGSLVKPLALNKHLHEVNEVQCGLQEALVSSNVNHALQHSHRLIQHTLRVSNEICNRQRASIEMSL
jgi:hypothetical protein